MAIGRTHPLSGQIRPSRSHCGLPVRALSTRRAAPIRAAASCRSAPASLCHHPVRAGDRSPGDRLRCGLPPSDAEPPEATLAVSIAVPTRCVAQELAVLGARSAARRSVRPGAHSAACPPVRSEFRAEPDAEPEPAVRAAPTALPYSDPPCALDRRLASRSRARGHRCETWAGRPCSDAGAVPAVRSRSAARPASAERTFTFGRTSAGAARTFTFGFGASFGLTPPSGCACAVGYRCTLILGRVFGTRRPSVFGVTVCAASSFVLFRVASVRGAPRVCEIGSGATGLLPLVFS